MRGGFGAREKNVEKKKHVERMSGSVRGSVCGRGSGFPQASEPGVLRLSFPPGRHFVPKLLHTQQEGSFPAAFFKPLVFVLVVGGCLLIFFFFGSLDNGL